MLKITAWHHWTRANAHNERVMLLYDTTSSIAESRLFFMRFQLLDRFLFGITFLEAPTYGCKRVSMDVFSSQSDLAVPFQSLYL